MADIKPLSKSSMPLVSRSSFNVGTKSSMCCVHDGTGLKTGVSTVFRSMSVSERKDKLKLSGRCSRCFGGHKRAQCKENTQCTSCSRTTHHTLMCTPTFKTSHTHNSTHVNTVIDLTEDISHDSPPTISAFSSRAVDSKVDTLYAIYETAVVSSDQMAVAFCDDGSDCTLISKAGV